ncbi:Uncharacterised protein [Mycobacterium tuberculosis]|nr:Uncharacterised protein [Mycobacterium tuberculosis]
MHVGVAPAPSGDYRQEIGQRLAFGCPVMRPQWSEYSRPSGFQHPEQVFQAPLFAVGGPQRVTLEVEEQVAGVWLRQQCQRPRVDDLELWCSRIALADLQFGLCGQLAQRVRGQAGNRRGVICQFGDRGDAGLKELVALADSHPSDQ